MLLKIKKKKIQKFQRLNEYQMITNDMVKTFLTAKICEMENEKKCNLNLESDLIKLMATNRNETMLKYYWTEWRKVSGEKIKSSYSKYVKIGNEAANLNGYENKANLWMEKYEVDDFEYQIGII